MRQVIALSLVVLSPGVSLANPPEKLYYLGEVKRTAADGKPMSSQVILLEKIHEPDKATITERAIVVKPDGAAVSGR